MSFTRYSVFRDQIGVKRKITTSLALVKSSARFRVGGLYVPGRLKSFFRDLPVAVLPALPVEPSSCRQREGYYQNPPCLQHKKHIIQRKRPPVSPGRPPYALSRGSLGNYYHIW